MNIVVLIKPVADVTVTDGWSIGSLDLYALSHAVELRDSTGGATHVLIVGPADSVSVAQRALASGADSATHIVLENPETLDALALAKLIQSELSNTTFDLILAGQTSEDVETGLVGPMLAELLQLPHVSTVTRISAESGELHVERDVVGGKQLLNVTIPAVLVVLSGREIPLRYPTPRGMIAARKKPIRQVQVELAVGMSGISWSDPSVPERSGDGEIIRDVPAAGAAKRIAEWLRARGLTG